MKDENLDAAAAADDEEIVHLLEIQEDDEEIDHHLEIQEEEEEIDHLLEIVHLLEEEEEIVRILPEDVHVLVHTLVRALVNIEDVVDVVNLRRHHHRLVLQRKKLKKRIWIEQKKQERKN